MVIFFITTEYSPEPKGGRALFTLAIAQALSIIAKNGLTVLELNRTEQNRRSLANFLNYLHFSEEHNLEEISSKISKANPDVIVLDGSNLGFLARHIKRGHANVPIITQCHNAEWFFFIRGFLVSGSLKYLVQAVIHLFREFNSVRYSDLVRCVTDTDKRFLSFFTHKGKFVVSPLFIATPHPVPTKSVEFFCEQKSAGLILFVGSNFYGNLHGLDWYIRNVHPFVPQTLVVAGINKELLPFGIKNGSERIVFLGYHQNAADLYRGVSVCVAPIFHGSGMKTKVAEAMYYGVPVVGTRHSFYGYSSTAISMNYCCETPNEFISVLNKIEPPTLDQASSLRASFYHSYSVEAGARGLMRCIESILDSRRVQ